jgi:hypothetical protein
MFDSGAVLGFAVSDRYGNCIKRMKRAQWVVTKNCDQGNLASK